MPWELPWRAGGSGRTLKRGGPSVDGELGLVVEDDVHLLHPVVEVVADAAAGMQHAPVDEQEIGGQGVPSQEGHVGHLTGAAVNGLDGPQRPRAPCVRSVPQAAFSGLWPK